MSSTRRPALPDLIDVARPARPVASVYTGTSPLRPWRARWTRLADDLRSDGADPAIVDALGTALRRGHAAHPGGTLVAFAGDELAPRVFHAPGLHHLDLAWFSAPAHVLPLLAWVQERPSCLVVTAGREDAELVVGARRVVLSYPTGSWHDGVRSVAAASTAMLSRHGLRLLLVAGESEVVGALWEALPTPVRRDATVRWVGTDLTPSRIAREARAAARSWTEGALADFHGRAHLLGVEGAGETLAALAGGRVEDLFVACPEDVTATAWYGQAPTDVAAQPDPARSRRCGLLADVAVRAALLSGTRVHTISAAAPGAPEDGIGGLCRVPLTLVRS